MPLENCFTPPSHKVEVYNQNYRTASDQALPVARDRFIDLYRGREPWPLGKAEPTEHEIREHRFVPPEARKRINAITRFMYEHCRKPGVDKTIAGTARALKTERRDLYDAIKERSLFKDTLRHRAPGPS